MSEVSLESSTNGSSRVPRAIYPIVIALTILLAYSNSFKGPFLLDDLPNIVENPDIRSITTSWRSAFDRARLDITLAGRPVAAVTFAINWAISGENIWSYRLVNVLIHVASALALYGIARRTPRVPESLAFVIALVWALHPLQVTSVTYVVQRVESLAGLCILLTLYCFIRGSTGGSRWWFGGAVLSCAIGMGVKETVAVAPLLVLLYDRTFLAGSFAGAIRARSVWYAALATTWVILIALLIASPRTGLFTAADWATRLDYLRTQCWAIAHYLRLSIWPVGTVLDYGGPAVGQVPGDQLRDWLPSAVLLTALLAGTIVALARRWPIGFAGAWFLLILAPSSSIVPIPMEAIAEHRMYLPLAAVVCVVVLGIARFVPDRVVVITGFIAAAAILGWMTFARNALFRDEIRLWSNDVARQSDNARTRTVLGLRLFESRRFDDGIREFQHAIRIKPTYAEAWHNLGDAMLRTRRPNEAEEAYRRAIALPPPSFKTHYNYGQLLMVQQRYGEAVAQFQRALELNPDSPEIKLALQRAGSPPP